MNKQIFTSVAPVLAVVLTAATVDAAEVRALIVLTSTAPPLGHIIMSLLVEKTVGIVGGSARIARTRIPVWTLESYRRLGATNATLLEAFPTLRSVDLEAAWSYASANIAEVERDIAENNI